MIFLRAATGIFIFIAMQSDTCQSFIKREHSIIMKIRVPEDEVDGHKGDNFSACNHYDFHLYDLAILYLAKFHSLLSGRSRDRDDDKVLLN